jgi:2-(1,2-epoxy-1,2-dihydrophenyl)acetyl-CoA isomerase
MSGPPLVAEPGRPPRIRLELVGSVAELRLCRPERHNALDPTMVAELMAALDAAESASVRALLICADGRSFCSGRDLSDARPAEEDAKAILQSLFNPMVERIATFPAPSIAAVQGAALGVGLGIALACDLVLACSEARLGSPFARIGAVLDSGAHAGLVRRIGAHRTLELVYTGRLLDGDEAAAWGLVNRVLPAEELELAARELATTIAAGPTSALLASKRIVATLAGPGMSLEAVLAAEAEAQGAASRTADYQEGISAFQQRRPPSFSGA